MKMISEWPAEWSE